MRVPNVLGYVRKYGVRAALHDIECRLVNKVAHFEILKGMTVRVRDVHDPSLFEAKGFDARFVGDDELAKFAHEGAHELSVDFLRNASGRGDRCYALFHIRAQGLPGLRLLSRIARSRHGAGPTYRLSHRAPELVRASTIFEADLIFDF